jgi:predicted TIM-barrel fold metal-dependent hydrolase
MPEVKKALQNVYFDTAASPYLYGQAVYRQTIDSIGSGHVLFGSDYPLMPPARVLKEIQAGRSAARRL